MNGITLYEWLKTKRSEEEKRDLLLNMDIALKYLNDRDMMVTSFNPNDIEIMNNDVKEIMFNSVDHMNNIADSIVRRNIYEEAKLALSIYLNYFEGLNDDFLKSNYDEFVFAIPADDVNYYKGIIVNGSSVYFSEFDFEKRKRDIMKLNGEVKDDEMSNDLNGLMPLNNDSINNKLYSKVFREGAYANTSILPKVMILFGFIICFISIVLYVFGL